MSVSLIFKLYKTLQTFCFLLETFCDIQEMLESDFEDSVRCLHENV